MINPLVACPTYPTQTSTPDNAGVAASPWTRLPNLLTVLLLVLIAANYFGTFTDLDFAWQIRTGEQIVEQGTLRPPDAFTYTIHGQHIPDFEWLYELVLYGIWHIFGFGGLKFLRVVLVAMPLVLVALRLRGDGVRWHGIVLSLFVAIFVLAPAWNLRPMYCTTIGLLLVSWWLRDHCTGRRPLSWWLPAVMLAWSNLHPGVITGQGILLGAIGWEWLNRRLQWNTPLDRAALHRLTLIGGLGVIASFIGPDPIERLMYPFKPELAHPIMRIFVEMQPTYFFVLKPPFSTGLAYVVAALVLVTVILRFRHYRLWELAMLLGLTGLANIAIRSLQDWLLIMLVLGAPHLAVLLGQASRQRRRLWAAWLLRADRGFKRLFNSCMFRFQPAYLLGTIGVLFIVSVIPPISRAMPMQNASDWPVAAVDRIEELDLKGRFFAPPDYGSYLTWRLKTDVRTFTDTRGFFFPPGILEDSMMIPKCEGDWQKRLGRVLDEHRTDYFLLETTGDRGELWRRMHPHIANPLFLDEQTVLVNARQVRQAIPQLSK